MSDWGPIRRKLPAARPRRPEPKPGQFAGPLSSLSSLWKPLPPERVPYPVTRVDAARLEHAIRSASEESPAEAAVQRIDSLWQTIDALASLAESRMRIVLSRVRGPELASEPRWLSEASTELLRSENADLGVPNRGAVDSARRLARALLAIHPKRRAELEPAPAGSVFVKWGDSSLRWLVSAPRLPWPGTSVRVYVRADPSVPKMQQETFHHAQGVLEHASKNL